MLVNKHNLHNMVHVFKPPGKEARFPTLGRRGCGHVGTRSVGGFSSCYSWITAVWSATAGIERCPIPCHGPLGGVCTLCIGGGSYGLYCSHQRCDEKVWWVGVG